MDYDVLEARYVRDYVLWLKFRDGTSGEVDLRDALRGPVFDAVKAPAIFRSFTIDPNFLTIAWPNGADLAPEFLHDQVRAANA